ncbi:unnamed protein product [Lampetra planeri]
MCPRARCETSSPVGHVEEGFAREFVLVSRFPHPTKERGAHRAVLRVAWPRLRHHCGPVCLQVRGYEGGVCSSACPTFRLATASAHDVVVEEEEVATRGGPSCRDPASRRRDHVANRVPDSRLYRLGPCVANALRWDTGRRLVWRSRRAGGRAGTARRVATLAGSGRAPCRDRRREARLRVKLLLLLPFGTSPVCVAPAVVPRFEGSSPTHGSER